MKGLKNRTESKTFFVTPSGGKLTLSSKTEKDGYVKREFVDTKTGATSVKYVLEFDQLTVYLKDIKAEDTDYGRRWSVKGTFEDEVYYLQFKYSSGYSRSFMNQLEMVDLSKPVTITCSYREEEYQGRTVGSSSLWMAQDGKWVGFKYSKENPGDRPDWDTITVKGETIKDDTKIQQYYEQVATRLFNELKLNEDKAAADSFLSSEIDGSDVTIPAGAMESRDEGFIKLTEDDLPF